MRRTAFFSLLFFCLTALPVLAQQKTKEVNISSTILVRPGTPRVVRNDNLSVWVVAWKQGTRIRARIVQQNGTPGPFKTLVRKVSSAEQNFDISYDSVSRRYLLAFENAQGLQVRLFNENLAAQGPATLIEGGVKKSMPRLTFRLTNRSFTILWFSGADGIDTKRLRSRTLASDGTPSGPAKTVVEAAGSNTYGSLSVAQNPKGGRLLAMFVELNPETDNGSMNRVTMSAVGARRGRVRFFQGPTSNLRSVGQAVFSNTGKAFGIWADRTVVKYRATSGGTGVKSIPNSADANSVQTSIAFDLKNKQFVGSWAKQNQVLVSFITLAGVSKQPVTIATSRLGNARNAMSSADKNGNTLVIWEDSNSVAPDTGRSVRFRVRGAIVGTKEPEPQPTEPDIATQPTSLNIVPPSPGEDTADLRISNAGDGELNINTVEISVTDPGDGCFVLSKTQDNCSGTQLTNNSCVVTIKCVDNGCGLLGFNSSVEITSDDADENPLIVPIQCGAS